MRQRDLKLFRKLLEERKQEILNEAERAVGQMNNGAGGGYADPTDRATMESDRNFLAKIEEAVARIDEGTYGRCEECGNEIGIERLKARPVTTFCISCKSAQEARERQG